MTSCLEVSRADGISVVTLNRPAKHNAITADMYRGLPDVMHALEEDPSTLVIVLRGAGQRAFSAGADISEFAELRGTAAAAETYNARIEAAETAIEEITKPTIAMIHGICFGGGAGLALACDLRFADHSASFAITPAKLGIVYSLRSTKRLVDLVGPARARYILYSANRVPADDCLRIGVADRLCATDALEAETFGFAQVLAGRAQETLRATKDFVARILAGQVSDDSDTRSVRNGAFGSTDYQEGVHAFLEKRSPRFNAAASLVHPDAGRPAEPSADVGK